MEEIDGIAAVAEDAAAGMAADAGLGQAAEVEDNAPIREAAAAPEIAAKPGEDANAAVDRVAQSSTMGQKAMAFAKWSAQTVAATMVGFGIIYGIQKAMAQKAAQSGQRTCLSAYLAQVEATYLKQNLTWDADHRQRLADDAMSDPWVDMTC